jgi:hypothetical protein
MVLIAENGSIQSSELMPASLPESAHGASLLGFSRVHEPSRDELAIRSSTPKLGNQGMKTYCHVNHHHTRKMPENNGDTTAAECKHSDLASVKAVNATICEYVKQQRKGFRVSPRFT